MSLSRSLLGLLAALMVGASGAAPALAYGVENWKVGFSGTGVAPGTGQGFGFWGWCAFGGGVASGNTGDCQFAQYFHTSAGGGFTCHESLDITSWTTGSNGDFLITGTVTVTPTGLTAPCVAFFPGPGLTSFSGVDSGIPAKAGHYNFGSLGTGLVGSLQIQVTQLP